MTAVDPVPDDRTATTTPVARVPRPRPVRQPELDGIRGLAVAAVLLFHAGFGWMSGGYVGVSVFFTLSGFLITRLLLDEHRAAGTIGLGAFWRRRTRRLFPASAVCIAGVVVLSWLGAFGDSTSLRTDVLGALLQVFNWTQLASGDSYGELLSGGAGPLDHYWSLAIEEQFYWLWPLAMVGVLAWARRRGSGRDARRRTVVALAGIAATAAVAAPVIAAVFGPDAAYWATPARAAEILVGALLAGVAAWRPLRRTRVLTSAGPVALAALLVVAVTWPPSSGPAYSGWMPVVAVVSALLVASASVGAPDPVWGVPATRLHRALSASALVVLGRISYGVYLYHWPVFVLLSPDRVDLGRAPLAAVRIGITLVLAVASYRFLERPILDERYRRRHGGRVVDTTATRPLLVWGAGTLVLALVAVVALPSATDRFANAEAAAGELEAVDELVPLVTDGVPAAAPGAGGMTTPLQERAPADAGVPDAADRWSGHWNRTVDPADAPTDTEERGGKDGKAGVLAERAAEPTAPAVAPTPSTVPAELPLAPPQSYAPPRPVRVLVVGDSTAWTLGDGMVAWSNALPHLMTVGLNVAPGCGLVRAGRPAADELMGFVPDCTSMLAERLPAAIAEKQPDVVVVMASVVDLEDRLWADGEAPMSPLDPAYTERLRAEYLALATSILDAGVPRVVWLKGPRPTPPAPAPYYHAHEPGRMEAQHAVIDSLPAADARIAVADLSAWYAASTFAANDAGRFDGVHLDLPAAVTATEELVAPVVLRAVLGQPG